MGSQRLGGSQVGGTVVGSGDVGDEDLGKVWQACRVGELVGKGPASGNLLEKVDEEIGVAYMDA